MSTDKRERQKARRAERIAEEAASQQKAETQRRLVRIGAVIVSLVAIVGIGFVLIQGVDVTLGVPAATVTDDAGTGAAVGSTAPTVTGSNPDGDEVVIGGTGAPQAVTFVAHWCPHCQDEIPRVAEWVADGQLADGVELVAVSTRHDPARPNWPPDEWLAGEDFPGEVLVDSDETAADAWALEGTPLWVFLDAEGTVVERLSGEITAEEFAAGSTLAASGGPAG